MELMQQHENNNEYNNLKAKTNSTTLLSGTFYLLDNKIKGWIVDSGALDHICHNLAIFDDYRTLKGQSR